MRIWIDLGNSPHVLFFRPIIRTLEEQGHDVRITACDFAQTAELADRFALNYESIGCHGGRSLHRKGLNLFRRSLALMRWAYGVGIDLAVSHNSYSQCLAAFMAGIPSVTIMDYEHQPANHLSFRLARRVIVPEAFPENALRLYGASEHKVKRYPGLKEEVYLSLFTPDPAFLANEGLDSKKIIATVRPPATFALYHRFENPLFFELMAWLANQDDVLVILLPRVEAQKEFFLRGSYHNLLIPSHALDGPNLLYHSDLVISAGGTMNREAAVLGTPVYSIFAGRKAAVDNYLIQTGRMVMIQDRVDFARIKLRKKSVNGFRYVQQSPLKSIVDLMINTPEIGIRSLSKLS
jgi:predicted glycosyltransferase